MSRRLVFAAACLGMLIFGIVLTILGAVLPSIIARFGIGTASAGSLFLLLSFGILIGSLLFGLIVDRYGYKTLLVICAALILAGIEGIAFAPSLRWLRLSVFAIGLGGGVINGGTNALVADISEDGRSAGLSLLGVFFGIAAVGMPFTLGMLLDAFGYTAVVAALGLTVLVPIAFMLAIRFPSPKQPQGIPIRPGARLLRDPALLLFGAILFCQSGLEITVGGWTAIYSGAVLRLDARSALFFLSLYWLGMMIARLVLSTTLKRVPPVRALRVCIAIGFAGAVLLIATSSVLPAALGVFLVGAGLAATFPVVLGLVADRYASLSGTSFSIVLVMALTGGMLLPWLTGVLGSTIGLRTSFLIVPVGLAALALLLAIAVRRSRSVPAVAVTIS